MVWETEVPSESRGKAPVRGLGMRSTISILMPVKHCFVHNVQIYSSNLCYIFLKIDIGPHTKRDMTAILNDCKTSFINDSNLQMPDSSRGV